MMPGIAVDGDGVARLDLLGGGAEPDDGRDLQRTGEDGRMRGDAPEVGGVAEDLVPAEDDGVGRSEGFGDDDGFPFQSREELLVLDVADDPVHHVVDVVGTLVHVLVGGGEHQLLVLADLVDTTNSAFLSSVRMRRLDGAHQDRVAQDHDLGFEDLGALRAELLLGEGEDLLQFFLRACDLASRSRSISASTSAGRCS